MLVDVALQPIKIAVLVSLQIVRLRPGKACGPQASAFGLLSDTRLAFALRLNIACFVHGAEGLSLQFGMACCAMTNRRCVFVE